MSIFTEYNAGVNSPSDLVNAILANSAGLSIDFSSIRFVGSGSQVSFYDGSLSGLGVGRGILLTSGDGTPQTSNTETDFGTSLGTAGDTDLDNALQAAGIDENSRDVTYLEFTFTVTDPNIKSIAFDLVFGSDEYPEYADNVVDIAGVFVNGTNYALFNNDPTRPLSVLQRNIDAGHFLDNQNGSRPLEYDGISIPLSIVAPVNQGVNTIKIAIGDTNDSILDSGLFISNLRGSTQGGGGIITNPDPNPDPGSELPVAVDDSAAVAEDRFSLDARTFTGNVLSNDKVSATGSDLSVAAVGGIAAAIGQVVQGSYGTLTLRADGSYSYSLANTDALIEGEVGTEQFTYTVSDSSGGTDTATLNLMIQGSDLELRRDGEFKAHRGADQIMGGGGADHVAGRAGSDTLRGEEGDDILWGEEGDDELFTGDGSDQAAGGAGDDTIWLGTGNDRAWGEGDNDILQGEDGNDVLDGGDANDLVRLGLGNDAGFGGTGNDRLLGDEGQDKLYGQGGDDSMEGGSGNDKLWGGDGADKLAGGDGSDQFSGGDDKDLIHFDGGNDTAWGGGGDDRFIFQRGPNEILIKDFQPGDTLVLEGVYRSFAHVDKHMKEVGDDVVIDLPGGGTITLEGTGRLGSQDFDF